MAGRTSLVYGCHHHVLRLVSSLIAAASWSAPSLYAQGFVTTVAGNGATAYFGEGLVATSAGLQEPSGLAVDSSGNVFIADGGSRIRKVTIASSLINTVAGSTTGTPNLGFSGDGGPATSAAMSAMGIFQGVAVDAQNNFYFADINNNRIRKVDANGIISTFAGSGQLIGGSSGQATAVSLFNPHGVAVDAQGNVYIADTGHNKILKVSPSGEATTLAGTGVQGYSGDGGPAMAAQLALPRNVFVAGNGTVYISDYGNNRVRKIDGGGVITTVAGNGTVLFTGDGGPGPNAGVSGPMGLAVDAAGNLYIADNGHDRIRKVDAAGTITTAVGNGAFVDPFKDGDPPLETRIVAPKGIVIDAQGTLYFSDSGFNRVRKIGAAKPGKTITGSYTSLSFTVPVGSTAKPAQLVQIGSSSDALTFTASATSTGGPWLSVTATGTTTPTSIRITLNPAGLAAGVYDGTVTLTPAEPQDIPLNIFVTLTVTPATPAAGSPALSEGGVVNGASFAPFPNPIAAGAIVALFGTNLASGTTVADDDSFADDARWYASFDEWRGGSIDLCVHGADQCAGPLATGRQQDDQCARGVGEFALEYGCDEFLGGIARNFHAAGNDDGDSVACRWVPGVGGQSGESWRDSGPLCDGVGSRDEYSGFGCSGPGGSIIGSGDRERGGADRR